jgi:hypothetical protein
MQTARFHTHGRSQAVRLPMELRPRGRDVPIKRLDNIVRGLDRFSGDFTESRKQPPAPR